MQQTTTQEMVVEASQLLEGLELETTIAAVHDLLLQATQQLVQSQAWQNDSVIGCCSVPSSTHHD